MQHDRRLHILIELLDVGVVEIGVPVKQREGALLHRQIGAGKVGFAGNRLRDRVHPDHSFVAAIGDAEHQQRIGDTSHPEADPALVLRFLGLLRQRVVGDLDHVVEHPDGSVDQFLQGLGIETCSLAVERMLDQRR